jgi:hypothetical protein
VLAQASELFFENLKRAQLQVEGNLKAVKPSSVTFPSKGPRRPGIEATPDLPGCILLVVDFKLNLNCA